MKKLLVLAAVAAMAMGAKAEYYTLDFDGAQAVYTLSLPLPFALPKEVVAATYWQTDARPVLFDESTAKQTFGGETWADNYAAAEALFVNGQLGQSFKFSGSDGRFSYEANSGGIVWPILVLTDATEISPGAAYAVYYGTSVEEGPITLDMTPIESGTMMSDAAAIPEPTSGLLLLLGVAGLALKRKRA